MERGGGECVSTKLHHRGLTMWSSQEHTHTCSSPRAQPGLCVRVRQWVCVLNSNAATHQSCKCGDWGEDGDDVFGDGSLYAYFYPSTKYIHNMSPPGSHYPGFSHVQPRTHTHTRIHTPVISSPLQGYSNRAVQLATLSGVIIMKMHLPYWLQRPCLCWLCLYSFPQPPAHLWRNRGINKRTYLSIILSSCKCNKFVTRAQVARCSPPPTGDVCIIRRSDEKNIVFHTQVA